MARENINDLIAFLAVAREQSFTRAAAQLGVSQSALSHTVRSLERRLGLRLLTRTTRSVATTEAGERLLRTVGPRLEEIEAELESLGELRTRPAGTIRITTGDHAADTILWPRLAKVLRGNPDIKVEIAIDYGLTDIVAQRYDAGVRLGEQVAKDMIAVRIGPDLRFAVVGTEAYLAERPAPRTPQDLIGHSCINLRFPTLGDLYVWEFERGGRELKVRVEGQVVFNGIFQILNAALDGLGLPTCRRTGAAASCNESPQAGAGGLVPVIARLPPLLPEPPPVLRSLYLAGGSAAISPTCLRPDAIAPHCPAPPCCACGAGANGAGECVGFSLASLPSNSWWRPARCRHHDQHLGRRRQPMGSHGIEGGQNYFNSARN